MSDFSEHSVAAKLAVQRGEQQALLGNWADARTFFDTAIRELKMCRCEVIGKANTLPPKRESV